MTTALQFCDHLRKNGFDFFTSVPCSIFKKIISTLDADPEMIYIPAVREDTAVGIAAGAFMAGRRPMVLIQNSGLGVCLNSLTSLAMIYNIPLLMLISWRGYQGIDAPEHIIMGKTMPDLMTDIGLSYRILEQESILDAVTESVDELYRTEQPLALILRDGILG